MGFQCVPQILGLVYGDGMRKDGKGQAQHRANVKAIVHEAFEIADPDDGHPIPIRKSASDTYDKTRTVNNKYTGDRTADGVLRLLDEEADKTKVEVKTVDKKTGETVIHKRSLPSTTVLAAAVIFNPPSKVAKDWTPEQYDKFFNDCEEVLAQIPFGKINKKGEIVGPKYYIFSKENIVASAEHWDEGEDMSPPIYTGHKHSFYKPEGEDGKYYGKFIDSYNLTHLNKNFARMMRERGWDIDDPDCTDWEKFNEDKAYRAKRKSKIRQGGKSVNKYRADKRQEELNAQLEELSEMTEQVAEIKKKADQEKERSDARILEAEASVRAAKEEREQEEAARDKASQERSIIQGSISFFEGIKTGVQREIDALNEKKESLETERNAVQAELDQLKKEADDLKKNKIAAAEQTAREAAQKERKRIVAEITADARREADELRRTKVELAEKAAAEAAEAKRNEITASIIKDAQAQLQELREQANKLKDWMTSVKEQARKITENAKEWAENYKADVRKSLTGLPGFLAGYFGSDKFKITKEGRYKGKTWYDVAQDQYLYQIRQERMKRMPGSVANTGKGRQMGQDGRDITDD